MAVSSLRAARPAAKGGLPNLIFAVAAAERPPAELRGRVDEVSVLFPWGSLLRGVLALDPVAAAGLATLLAPGGRIRTLASVTDRDGPAAGVSPADLDDRDALAARWGRHGVELIDLRRATDEEIAASGSTWAKRLLASGTGRDRDVRWLELGCGAGLAIPGPRRLPTAE
jgi:16S rRNA (adenine(1408)-N(1))-methyltransferase